MNQPNVFHEKTEWIIVGPMGPKLPKRFDGLPILAVDGGLHHVERFDFWVGDGDSAQAPSDESKTQKLPAHKDKSDLACSLENFHLEKPYRFHLWGFTGGRIDHELLVMGECHQFLKNRQLSRLVFYNSQGKVAYEAFSRGDWTFSHEGLFSVIVIEESQVSIKGNVKYPVPKPLSFAPLSSLGLSNEAFGEIGISSSLPFVLFYPEGK
jgi:thiamine pyrophosphokinase